MMASPRTNKRELAQRSETKSPVRDLRIVMADDDRNDQLLMSMAADDAGLNAEFVFVDTGAQLLCYLTDAEREVDLPDLVILDLRMPGLDGHRTLDEMQKHPVLWQIPVVVFTSSTRPIDELMSFERGARWFETKSSEYHQVVEFTKSLASRVADRPYFIMNDEGDDATKSLIDSDIVAEIEEQIMREFPE